MTHQIMIHSQKSDFEILNSESWMIGPDQITVPVRFGTLVQTYFVQSAVQRFGPYFPYWSDLVRSVFNQNFIFSVSESWLPGSTQIHVNDLSDRNFFTF